MRARVAIERWPLREAFTISRGDKREAVVVVVTCEEGPHRGRGECVPYARYGETPDAVVEAVLAALDAGHAKDRETLRASMAAGAARNALDLALFDLECKRSGRRAYERLGVEARAVTTVFTLPIRSPEETERRAREESSRPILKLKMGAEGDLARVEAARRGAPDAELIVDANEGWTLGQLEALAPQLSGLGVVLIEQPLPAADDAALEGWDGPVPLCADESFLGDVDPATLAGRYGAINVKLDKQGGLTACLDAVARARSAGLEVMVGSMVATSLAVAPALLLSSDARWLDVDGPLFMARDREPGLRFEGSRVSPAPAPLWG